MESSPPDEQPAVEPEPIITTQDQVILDKKVLETRIIRSEYPHRHSQNDNSVWLNYLLQPGVSCLHQKPYRHS